MKSDITASDAALARPDGELPLEYYGAIGDGRSVALVGADGSIDWWCVPSLDSVPFLDRLLAPGSTSGRFSITPVEPFSVSRCYRPDSNVLQTVFSTASGRVRITDSLNSGISGRLPWSELARRVEGLDGIVELAITMRPGERRDTASAWCERTREGPVFHVDGIVAALRMDCDAAETRIDDRHVAARLSVQAGVRHCVALLCAADTPLILPPLASIDERIDRSHDSWREWTRNLRIEGPYADAVRRSALALKLLLFAPTGAIAAAATTSLPERIGGDKNFDYRYAWVRDVAFTVKAFLRIGAIEEAKAAFSWLTATIRRHGGDLRTMYQLDGELAPGQDELDNLPGYRHSQPVRRGNFARGQVQLGMFGDLMETAALFVRSGHILDLSTRRLLGELADRCCDIWRRPDSGLWELPEVQQYTMSRIECWTALDRAAELARTQQIDGHRVERWLRERDVIRDWIDAHCWSEAKQAYAFYPGSDRLDAALLLASRLGFERKDRLASTREAIVRELTRGPLVYRYSGADSEEGTFTACGFWLVEAYAILGERARAEDQMAKMIEATSGDLGLFSEQVDPDSGAMLGNLPQALSHLAMIHAALALQGI
ncbi:glycoside hydrolase family 15 protein [Paraburkholderia sp.]|uniref:glycoside hydrolase family 15 protein n=1 Tax=Paraburkholderia sp. TaxID=1926495 RepID=UPI002F421823